MEGNTNFGTEHLNVLAIETFLGRLVHSPQELTAVDTGLGRKSCQINLVILGLEIRLALSAQTCLQPCQNHVNLFLNGRVRLGFHICHQLVLLDHSVAVYLRRRYRQWQLFS